MQDAGAPKIFTHQNAVRSQRYYIALLLTSFAVGLLIVFRTNSSYARWFGSTTCFSVSNSSASITSICTLLVQLCIIADLI